MKEISLKAVFQSIATTFVRYNLTIFIVVLVTGLAVAVIMLNTILLESSDTPQFKSTTDISSFDQQTIDRVNQLHRSSDSIPEVTLPSGRINPFAE